MDFSHHFYQEQQMRVDLSSWEKTRLSIPNRRRKVPGVGVNVVKPGESRKSSGYGSKITECKSVATSFVPLVPTRRPIKKTRRTGNLGDNVVPHFVVTGENRIVIIGRRAGLDASLEESQILQYDCRPGIRFLPNDDNLPCVSAVMDPRNGRLVCLENDNRRLISWSTSSTPDNAAHASFDEPLLSLSLLGWEGRTLVYGTLQSQDLFVASCEENAIKVQTFSSSSSVRNPKHVGTIHAANETDDMKRKHARTQDHLEGSFSFYQIFAHRRRLVIVRHSLTGLQSAPKEIETASVQISVSINDSFPDRDLDSAELLGTIKDGDDNEELAVVLLRIGGEMFVGSLSLRTGSLLQGALRMPAETKCISIVHGCFIAAYVSTDVFLFDIHRAALLSTYSVTEIVPLQQNRLPQLVGDCKTSDLIVLSDGDEGFQAMASCRLISTGRSRLADALSSAQGDGMLRPQSVVVNMLLSGNSTESLAQRDRQATEVQKALSMIHTTSASIRSSCGAGMGRNSLLDTVQKAANLILGVEYYQLEKPENPQENGRNMLPRKVNGAHESVVRVQQNGVHSDKRSSFEKQILSGTAAGALPFENLPAFFLNEVAFIVANLIVGTQTSAKASNDDNSSAILQEIIATRKLNARILLRDENGDSRFVGRLCESMATSRGKEKPLYYSTEFIFDMFRYCQDLTESQMVDMLHFLIVSETPNNISTFIFSGKHPDADEEMIETSERFLAVADCKSSEEKIECRALSAKLLTFGVSLLLKEMLGYSRLNGALLRRNLMQVFAREELFVLCRFFPSSISSLGTSIDSAKRLIELVSAVCDCIHGLSPLSEEEAEACDTLHELVEQEVAFTENLFPLHAAMQHTNFRSGKRTDPSKSSADASTALVSAYQIERLVL